MKGKYFKTKFIIATGSKCQACWQCSKACPEMVIGKVRFLFHRHAIIRAPENCIGCLRCVKACKYGVISKIKRS
jgi:2-oxoglutarate ferredoxin oxidoreductase subunit delta